MEPLEINYEIYSISVSYLPSVFRTVLLQHPVAYGNLPFPYCDKVFAQQHYKGRLNRMEKIIPHAAMVATFQGLNKLWPCKYGKRLACMTFQCMIALRAKR